jgi:hypothetical protein
MGEDPERKGSMAHRSIRSRKDVYPVQDSGLPLHLPAEKTRRRISLLIPLIVLVNVVMFVITMYVNDCPKNTADGKCVAKFLHRFSFQPLNENPLFGPSSRA